MGRGVRISLGHARNVQVWRDEGWVPFLPHDISVTLLRRERDHGKPGQFWRTDRLVVRMVCLSATDDAVRDLFLKAAMDTERRPVIRMRFTMSDSMLETPDGDSGDSDHLTFDAAFAVESISLPHGRVKLASRGPVLRAARIL